MSSYIGNDSSEKLYSANWNFGWTSFRMKGGNDYVKTQDNVEYYFNGGSGNDKFYGNSAEDFVIGGDGNDQLYGYGENDYFEGGNNNDIINGGSGDDYINGGRGKDILYGGTDSDSFFFKGGDSNLKTSSVDTIMDWDGREDYIVTSGFVSGGNARNYAEKSTHATTIEAARDQAEGSNSLTNKTYVFLYNAAKDKGFLLMDLNGNGDFETGVVLKGAGHASDMSYHDII